MSFSLIRDWMSERKEFVLGEHNCFESREVSGRYQTRTEGELTRVVCLIENEHGSQAAPSGDGRL